ncbi:hypothetical protein VNO77_39312 [Canavalia gladiata]|uniref:Uncharacterized protein n=1 Tax=Canavalia gladiata TaxID=3824 RepID=A0AAN9PXM9_CANGL
MVMSALPINDAFDEIRLTYKYLMQCSVLSLNPQSSSLLWFAVTRFASDQVLAPPPSSSHISFNRKVWPRTGIKLIGSALIRDQLRKHPHMFRTSCRKVGPALEEGQSIAPSLFR